MKSISVIIPAYNVESFIDSSIQSVFDNIGCMLEVIIIDDLSKDNTCHKIDSWCNKYENINFIKLDVNIGQGAVRNYALKIASNEYVLFLDSDDLLAKEIKSVVELVENEDLIIFNHNLLWPDNSLSSNPQSNLLESIDGQILGRDDNKSRCDLLKNISVPWNKLYKRKFLIDNNISFTDGIYEDIPFHWEVIVKAESIKVLNIPAYLYRQREGSTLLSRSDKHSDLINQYRSVYASIEPSYRAVLDEIFIHHIAIVLLKKAQRLTDEAILNIVKGTKDIIKCHDVAKSYPHFSIKGKLLFTYLSFIPISFVSEISKRFCRGK